jgi:hypothetical protein
MKLHGVNHLSLSALDHHLIAAEIRGREQVKSFGHAVQLQAMVLPNPEQARLLGVVLP